MNHYLQVAVPFIRWGDIVLCYGSLASFQISSSQFSPFILVSSLLHRQSPETDVSEAERKEYIEKCNGPVLVHRKLFLSAQGASRLWHGKLSCCVKSLHFGTRFINLSWGASQQIADIIPWKPLPLLSWMAFYEITGDMALKMFIDAASCLGGFAEGTDRQHELWIMNNELCRAPLACMEGIAINKESQLALTQLIGSSWLPRVWLTHRPKTLCTILLNRIKVLKGEQAAAHRLGGMHSQDPMIIWKPLERAPCVYMLHKNKKSPAGSNQTPS